MHTGRCTTLALLVDLPAVQNPKGPYRDMEELWDEPELD